MNFGFCAPTFAGSGDAHIRTPLLDRVDVSHLRDAILEADRLGYDSLWAPDHLMLGRDSLFLEGLTFLSWASRLTNMRLGTIHLSNILRNPVTTARAIATLDIISDGRVEFFFEAGHRGVVPESKAYGLRCGNEQELLDRYVESIQIIKSMWTGIATEAEYRHYRVDGIPLCPKPRQSPHPPLWIGAINAHIRESPDESTDVRDLIALHANGCKVGPSSITDTGKILEEIRAACARHGRDSDSLRRLYATQILIAESESQVEQLQELISARNPNTSHYADWDALRDIYLIGDPPTVARRIKAYADLGIDSFFLWFMDYPSMDGARIFAESVMPSLRERAT